MRRISAVCVFCILLAACGGGGSSKPSASPTDATDTPATAASGAPVASTNLNGKDVPADAACKLITQDDATKLFGRPAVSRPDASPTSLAKSVCLWGANTDKGQTDDEIFLVQVRIYPSENFYGAKLFPNAKPLSGLGDKAFIHATGLGGQELQYTKDGDTYAISYSVVALGGNKPSPDQVATQLESLVRTAYARA